MNTFVLTDLKSNTRLSNKQIRDKGYHNIIQGIRSFPKKYMIGPYTSQNLTNYGFHEKAVKYLKDRELIRPLEHYKKTDGKLKTAFKKQFVLESFIKEQFFNSKSLTNEQCKLIPALDTLSKKMKSFKQKQQIKNLLKLTENVNLQNAVTYNNIKYSDAYVIKQDWEAGDRHIYKHDTLTEIIKRSTYITRTELEHLIRYPYFASSAILTTPRQALEEIAMELHRYPDKKSWGEKPRSPYTRREFTYCDVVPLKRVIDSNYKGKLDLMSNMKQNKAKTINEIASFYN